MYYTIYRKSSIRRLKKHEHLLFDHIQHFLQQVALNIMKYKRRTKHINDVINQKREREMLFDIYEKNLLRVHVLSKDVKPG